MAINKRWGAIKTLKNFIQVSNSEKQKSNLLELNKTQIKKKKKKKHSWSMYVDHILMDPYHLCLRSCV